MDGTTRRAIQAVVRGLFFGRVIGEEQVGAIMAELQEAASEQRDRGHQVDAGELMKLASDIGKDARIGD